MPVNKIIQVHVYGSTAHHPHVVLCARHPESHHHHRPSPLSPSSSSLPPPPSNHRTGQQTFKATDPALPVQVHLQIRCPRNCPLGSRGPVCPVQPPPRQIPLLPSGPWLFSHWKKIVLLPVFAVIAGGLWSPPKSPRLSLGQRTLAFSLSGRLAPGTGPTA